MQDIGFEGHADTKRIPPFVYSLMESDIGWLLNGYFSADGTGSGLGVFTTSEGLKADVVLLLNGMGILTSVTEHPPGHFFKDGKRYAKKRGWHISIRDTNSKKRFLEKIDFCIAYKHNAVFLDRRTVRDGTYRIQKRYAAGVGFETFATSSKPRPKYVEFRAKSGG